MIGALGCHQTISLGDDLRSSAAVATTDTNTDVTGESTSSDDDVSSASGEASGSFGATGGQETGTSDDATNTSSGTTGGICAQDSRDSECLSCVKTLCCPEAQSCNADPDCGCMLECVQGPVPSGCVSSCEPNTSAAELAACIAASCPMACN